MSLASGQAITMDDMDALATLANAKLSPATPYEFARFDATIEPPGAVIGAIVPGLGYSGDGQTLIIRVYSYNTVAGRKIYSQKYAQGSVTLDTSGSWFNVNWSWTAPGSAPTGYTVVSWYNHVSGFYDWADYRLTGGTSFTDDGTGWSRRSKITDGAWRRELLRLRTDIFLGPDDTVHPLRFSNGKTLGSAAMVSGPWCVAVGSVLQPSIQDVPLNGYQAVKFLFADGDAPSGILIQTTNTQTGLQMMTITQTAATSWTMPVQLLSGAAGHVQLVFTGGVNASSVCASGTSVYAAGVLTVDMDVTAGTTYDCTISTTTAPGSGFLQSAVDITLTTADASTIVDGVGLHPTAGVKSVAVPDSFFEVAWFGRQDSSSVASFDHCASGQMTMTETHGVDGVWVAKTPPVWAVQTFLDQDLPQYWADDILPADRLAAPTAGGAINPAVAGNNRSAIWPVFRSTDFGVWQTNRDLYPRPVPFWPFDPFHDFRSDAAALAPGETKHFPSLFLPVNLHDWQVALETSTLTIYVSSTDYPDPDNPATYDFSAGGGFTLSSVASVAAWQGATAYFTIHNTGVDAAVFNVRHFLARLDDASNYYGDAPVFFPLETSRKPSYEKYSYTTNFCGSGVYPGDVAGFPVPQKGYCIYEIILRRAPVDNGQGIALAPAADTADLTVTIGVMRGTQYGTAGTFTALQVFTIPAGQAELRASVFWPVLGGTPLAWQCAEALQVFPLVNFQPFACVKLVIAGDERLSTFSGGQHFAKQSNGAGRNTSGPLALLDYNNSDIAPRHWLLPVNATIYNDLEAVLNLLP